MKLLAHCSLQRLEGVLPDRTYIPTVSEPAFSALRAFAKEIGIYNTPYDTGAFFSICVPPEDPRLTQWFQRLDALGWTAAHQWVPAEMRSTTFGYRISRSYDESDLDAAELLYIMNWRHLTHFAGRDGDRWIGDVEYLGADTEEGWAQQIGTIGHQYFFVNSSVRREMIETGIRGLNFHSLRWNRPNRNSSTIALTWQRWGSSMWLGRGKKLGTSGERIGVGTGLLSLRNSENFSND